MARALLALELIQSNPGITAERLAGKLGVTERAARRYVGVLREADIPVESARGPYGGYRLGRGLRLPPLVFSATEALGLFQAPPPAGPLGRLRSWMKQKRESMAEWWRDILEQAEKKNRTERKK